MTDGGLRGAIGRSAPIGRPQRLSAFQRHEARSLLCPSHHGKALEEAWLQLMSVEAVW